MQFELLHYRIIWCNNFVFFLRLSFGTSSSHYFLLSSYFCLCVCVRRLSNLPISCVYYSHVYRFSWCHFIVGREKTMRDDIKIEPKHVHRHHLNYLSFRSFIPRKLYRSHGWKSEFISLMNFNTDFTSSLWLPLCHLTRCVLPSYILWNEMKCLRGVHLQH